MTTLQERLRDGADICHARNIQLDYAKVAEEAADRIDLDAAHIATLTKVVDRLQTERDELAADKEVLLNHMATIRNVTKEPQVSLLTRLVLERMAQGGGK